MFETWFQIKALLDYKLVDPTPVITHTIPFTDALKGLDLVCNKREPASKLVFFPMP
jgi:threonine 3-dehydrogenase